MEEKTNTKKKSVLKYAKPWNSIFSADYISSAYKLFEINAQDMKDLIRFWLSHRIKWAL